MRIRLPMPPTVNHYYAQRRTVRCPCCKTSIKLPPSYLTKQAKVFREQVKQVLMPVLLQERFGEKNLALLAELHPARNRGDVDNRNKPLLDALEHAGLFVDDKQIKDLRTRWLHPVVGGAVDIQLWEL